MSDYFTCPEAATTDGSCFRWHECRECGRVLREGDMAFVTGSGDRNPWVCSPGPAWPPVGTSGCDVPVPYDSKPPGTHAAMCSCAGDGQWRLTAMAREQQQQSVPCITPEQAAELLSRQPRRPFNEDVIRKHIATLNDMVDKPFIGDGDQNRVYNISLPDEE